MKPALIFVTCLLACIMGCQKPIPPGTGDAPAITFSVSLRDSIPQQTFRQLDITDVTGARILDTNGNDVRYFEYHINPDRLLNAIASSPFEINGVVADTTYRKITKSELIASDILDRKNKYAEKFLQPSDNVEIYESIKPPLCHLLVVDRTTTKVLHRISRL